MVARGEREGRNVGAGRRRSRLVWALAAAAALLVSAPPASAAGTAYVANKDSNDVSAYAIAADGALSPLAGSPFGAGAGPGALAVDPDGAHLHVPNEFSDDVSAYAIAADGALSPLAGSPFAAGGAPISVAVSPDGAHLYVANDDSGNVSAFAIAADGALSRSQALRLPPAGARSVWR